MNKFDKKIKKLIKNVEVPPSYDEKVDRTLLAVMKKGRELPEKRKRGRLMPRLAVCLLCILCVITLYSMDVHADIFAFFKETILDFLGGSNEDDLGDLGVKSENQTIGSKPDLIVELSESVMDSHSMYLLVTITAPADIHFEEDILFDYFCFCRGSNYNVNQLLGGSLSCELLEVNEDLPNMATYVVSLVFDEALEEDSEVTLCLKDLTKAPYSSDPKLLIGGIWSLTFRYNPTVSDPITVEGNEKMVFSFIDTTAQLERIELSPFGILVCADVSNFPYDELGVSDTTVAIRLKMIDGSELTVVSHDPDEQGYIQGGSVSYAEEGDRTYQQTNLEFTNTINTGKVLGVYIEDLYVPVK